MQLYSQNLPQQPNYHANMLQQPCEFVIIPPGEYYIFIAIKYAKGIRLGNHLPTVENFSQLLPGAQACQPRAQLLPHTHIHTHTHTPTFNSDLSVENLTAGKRTCLGAK